MYRMFVAFAILFAVMGLFFGNMRNRTLLKRYLVYMSVSAFLSLVAFSLALYDGITGEITKALTPEKIEKDGYTYILDKNPPKTIESHGATYVLVDETPES